MNKDYRAIWAEAYRFYERHSPPPCDATGWAACVDDMVDVARRFSNDPFLADLLCSVFAELERQYFGGTDHEQ